MCTQSHTRPVDPAPAAGARPRTGRARKPSSRCGLLELANQRQPDQLAVLVSRAQQPAQHADLAIKQDQCREQRTYYQGIVPVWSASCHRLAETCATESSYRASTVPAGRPRAGDRRLRSVVSRITVCTRGQGMADPQKSMLAITALVKAKMATGVLPSAHVGKIWIGKGSGVRCDVCEQHTGASDYEVEIDLAGTVTLRLPDAGLQGWPKRAAAESQQPGPPGRFPDLVAAVAALPVQTLCARRRGGHLRQPASVPLRLAARS